MDRGQASEAGSQVMVVGSSVEGAAHDEQARSHMGRAVYRVLPVAICLVYFGAAAYLADSHPLGIYTAETDFYHYYAPDAERLAAWSFPENGFQGPGYSVMLALGGKITGDLFTAGKWISVISATAAVWLAFLLFERLFGFWVGVGSQLILGVSTVFPQFSIVATTDMFFLMLCLATLVVFMTSGLNRPGRVAVTGAVAGLAYMTRYNAVFLVVTVLVGILLINLLDRGLRGRLRLSAIFVAVFLVTVSPWLYASYHHRGSPFYNTNYLNIATQFYPELAHENVFQEGSRRLSDIFGSFRDVLAYDPVRMLKSYPANLGELISFSMTADLVSPWVGWMAALGFVLALLEKRSKAVGVLLASIAIYFLIQAFTHWETRYFLFILVAYIGLAVFAAIRLFELARSRGLMRQHIFAALPIALVAIMWQTSLAGAQKDLKRFMARHPTEIPPACEYFKGEGITGARVMARKPHLAYICGQQWVYTPDVRSLDELKSWIEANPVDYVAIGTIEIQRRAALAPLKDPQSAPPWLRLVWMNADPLLILYKAAVDLGDSD